MIKSKKSITIALVIFIISLFLIGTLAVLTDMDKANRVSALIVDEATEIVIPVVGPTDPELKD